MTVNAGQKNDFSIFFVRHVVTLNGISCIDPLFESGDGFGVFAVEHGVGILAEPGGNDFAEYIKELHALRKDFRTLLCIPLREGK